jgi:hypothetical protein
VEWQPAGATTVNRHILQTFTQQHRRRFTRQFLMLFYALAAYKWLNGMWLYQMEPQFFNTRFDGTTWLLMLTGLHQWLLGHAGAQLGADLLFYLWPLVYAQVWQKYSAAGTASAFIWLIINLLYVQCYTLYPTTSIEAQLGWLLMPLLFAAQRLGTFYWAMQGLRYVFLFFLCSAGIWKLRQGGAFHLNQMSGVLLYQHKEFLVSAPNHWYSRAIYAIVKLPALGFAMYLGITVWELACGVGFFTKKYDRWLWLSFLGFLVVDYAVMRIPYFEVLPLALPLMYCRHSQPVLPQA